MKVAVMTDTNSGISVDEGKQLGVCVIPMPILIDGKTYYEGVDLTQGQFYQALQEGRSVSTSQPAPGDVLRLWDKLLEAHDAVVYIPMSSGLSASYRTALTLAADYSGKVQVIDHRSVSVPQRYGVMDALAMAEKGWEAAAIKEELEKISQDTFILIGVDTLEFLKKGGRITPAAAKMAAVLQLKPILQIRGERLDAFAKVRGTQNCKKRLIDELKRIAEPYQKGSEPYSVAASGSFTDRDQEQEWITMAQAAFPNEDVRYDPLAFSIGSHTGPGAFGMAVCKRVPLKDLS